MLLYMVKGLSVSLNANGPYGDATKKRCHIIMYLTHQKKEKKGKKGKGGGGDKTKQNKSSHQRGLDFVETIIVARPGATKFVHDKGVVMSSSPSLNSIP